MVRSRRQGGADKFSFGYTEYGMPRRLLEIHTHLEFRIEDRAEDKTLGITRYKCSTQGHPGRAPILEREGLAKMTSLGAQKSLFRED